MGCVKRTYANEHAARRAMKAAGNTVRPYRCLECHKIHVTKDRDGIYNHASRSRRIERKRRKYDDDND